MAARRSRIKGIAVIPQRRKPEKGGELEEICSKSTSTESDLTKSAPKKPSTVVSDGEVLTICKGDSGASEGKVDKIGVENASKDRPHAVEIVQEEVSNDKDVTKAKETCLQGVNDSKLTENERKQPTSLRRRAFKANVSISAATRRPKPKTEEPAQKTEPETTKLDEPPPTTTSNEQIPPPEPPKPDLEYPPAPPSPSKINRARIKAVPRLGQRRTSFSASESEDDTRRNFGRHRNDSVCSAASGLQESHPSDAASPPKKEFANVLQKKWKRTEQSRKLAEARREFNEKFGTKVPDRQKLTMIDLVFYNPPSRPMSQRKPRGRVKSVKAQDEEAEERRVLESVRNEGVDDPLAQQSDEENALPAPQIKIGVDGQIVVDETSLVIENKDVKKGREDIQKSALVDGDFDTGYGVYKRVKRSKDWTKTETLRFYKALNTIGTDFSLMEQIFPGRNRRELKMKFKKEERMNRTLVDRALMQPNNFDVTHLQHEAEMQERERVEKERASRELAEIKRQRKQAGKKRRKMDEDSDGAEVRSTLSRKRKKINEYADLKRGVNCFLDDESDADDESDRNEGSSSDSDSVIKIVEPQPTRSGRIPKIPQQLALEEQLTAPTKSKKNEPQEEAKVPEKKLENLEPGSIVVLSSRGKNEGETVMKLFMVTPERNKVPLNFSGCSESMKNIVTISTQKKEPLVENNVTIPEQKEACEKAEVH